ncbi:conjugal transfer protein TrbI [Sphingomonas cannabina]|uniref:TrbI/VirB10 family protein n=1 Tax=Sphingomonas cannabina TaxID=2899123 RepID=UPI001F33638B|nr:TrbI/VirB10 family protein [Sphingomonas cannabina]UIJ44742.1 conjugal transfer protein TrbI [Sphingomonas cannabina]
MTGAPEPDAVPAMESTPRKLDPETTVLRGGPSRAIRFKRGIVVAAAGAAALMVVATTWIALKPASLHLVPREDENVAPAKVPSDTLSVLPSSYGEVPKLGPPLPGDLGRPILERQRAIGAAPIATTPDAGKQAAEAERQRIAAERKAARESGVMVQVSGAGSANGITPAAASSAPASTDTDATATRLALDPERDPANQQRKADFISGKDAGGDVNPHVLVGPPSPYTLSAGTVIAASLITGLNSDLPGLVAAQVTENAYDTMTGRILLIPQGSRLIGSYDSVVAFGQKRALVVWQRIILPDGSSVRIDNVPTTDTAGYAGLADKVDLHTWQLLKGVALSTLLSVGTELSFSAESNLVRAIRESSQQSASRAGDQIVMKNLNIQPTIMVRPGWPLRIVVHKDIILRPWQSGGRP